MIDVGDKVVCVDNLCNEGIITLGKTYTVASVNRVRGTCKLKELPSYDWFLTRFQLVPKVDPLVGIRQSEYDEMVEEINLLRELLAEANHKLSQTLPEDFKPIAEYTMSDWQQALEEGWVFKLRNDRTASIVSLDYGNTAYPVETEDEWLRLDGCSFAGVKSAFDIVERIE